MVAGMAVSRRLNEILDLKSQISDLRSQISDFRFQISNPDHAKAPCKSVSFSLRSAGPILSAAPLATSHLVSFLLKLFPLIRREDLL